MAFAAFQTQSLIFWRIVHRKTYLKPEYGHELEAQRRRARGFFRKHLLRTEAEFRRASRRKVN